MHRFCFDKTNPESNLKVVQRSLISLLGVGFGWIIGLLLLASSFECLVWISNYVAFFYLQSHLNSALIGVIVTFTLIFLCVGIYFILNSFYLTVKRVFRRIKMNRAKYNTDEILFHPEPPNGSEEEGERIKLVN
jgi:hypothetical protein